MPSYRYPNIEFTPTVKPLDEPAPGFKYARTNFIGAGLDNYAQPPSQDPEMLSQMLNVMPVTDGTIDKRYGYSLWANPSATPTLQIFDYQSDVTGLREVILASDTFVRAHNDDGSTYNSALFTPTAGVPRATASRSYTYFSNGTDFKKWNGASSGGVTTWGVDVNNVTSTGSVVGPNYSGTVTDEGTSGTTGDQGENYATVVTDTTINTTDSVTYDSGTWTTPTNAQSTPDGTFTDAVVPQELTIGGTPTSTARTTELYAKGFGFSIPSTATILGIQVTVTKGLRFTNVPSTAVDDRIQLVNDSSVRTGSNLADGSTGWPNNTLVAVSYGGSATLWGASWTPTIVNSSNFGVVVSAYDTAGVSDTNGIDALVDAVSIHVWWSIAATTSWTNPNNIKVDDGSSATATATTSGTSELQAKNYGFSGLTSIITGIKVEIKASCTGGNVVLSPVLQKASADYGSTKNSTITSGGSLTYVVFGGSTDLWDGTWASTDINSNTGFGVGFKASTISGSATISIDAVRITVYSAPNALGLSAPSGTGITLTSGRRYTVTYQTSSTNYSDIGIFSASTGALANQGQPITGIPVHNDSQVISTIILATADGGDETRLYKVTDSLTVNNAATFSGNTYTDVMPEATLLTQEVFLATDASGNEFGVTNNDPPPAGFLFPTKHRGRIYMVKGPTLQWTKAIEDVTTDTSFIAGRWEECWPSQNSLDISELAETVQGLLSDGINLYMGTEFKIRRLQGDAPFIDPPDIVHNEVGVINQNVWKICFSEGSPVGAMWLTPDNRVIRSDFNTYTDVGTPVQTTLNSINMNVVKSVATASFYSLGPFDFFILAIPTGSSTVNDTLLVYNLRNNTWVTWQFADSVSQLLFHIQSTGAPELVIATNTGKLYTLTPGVYQDRIGATPVAITSTIQTSWLDLKDPTIRKALNELDINASDTAMTVTVQGASKFQDFTNPHAVATAKPLVLGPRSSYKVFLAGASSYDRYYKFTFTGTATSQNVLEAFAVEAHPLSRI